MNFDINSDKFSNISSTFFLQLQFTFYVCTEMPPLASSPTRPDPTRPIHPFIHRLFHINYNNNTTNAKLRFIVSWFAFIARTMFAEHALCFWFNSSLLAVPDAGCYTFVTSSTSICICFSYLNDNDGATIADDDTNENQVSPSEYFITVIIWSIVYNIYIYVSTLYTKCTSYRVYNNNNNNI